MIMLAVFTSGMKVMAAEATSCYACYNDGYLVFYYDSYAFSRPGDKYTVESGYSTYGWLTDHKDDITNVVFNNSFKDFKKENLAGMFYGLENLTTVDGTWNLNLEKATAMNDMFYGCKKLTTIEVGNWNTSHVQYMNGMFAGCSSLETLDVSNWNTANVTGMSSMFYGCSKLKSIDVSNWNTANVTDMSYMFKNCTDLETVPVGNWNLSSVTEMRNMFEDSGIKTIDLGNWNTSHVQMTNEMFQNCKKLTTIYCESSFNTTSIVSSFGMFYNCINLVGEKGTTYNPDFVNITYARIDGGSGNPGYFTSRSIPIDQAHFPDGNLRNMLRNYDFGSDGKLTVDEIKGIDELNLESNDIQNLKGIEYFTELKTLYFDDNHIQAVDLSRNTKLETIYCYGNEIYGDRMDSFIATIPEIDSGKIYVVAPANMLSKPDQNEMTPQQVDEANWKGWKVMVWNESIGQNGDWDETQGFWQINEARFPDSKFRYLLLHNEFGYDGYLTKEEVWETRDLNLEDNEIEDLTGIGYFSELKWLYINDNNIQTADLSKNNKLKEVSCYRNQIYGDNMDSFLELLPEGNDATLNVYRRSSADKPDLNEMTPEQVSVANGKGWTVKVYNELDNNWSETQGFWHFTEERFPDEKFRNFLKNESDYFRCPGVLTYEDGLEYEELLPSTQDIADLTGIEYFTGLCSLDCSGNKLKTIDLSKNTMLINIDCMLNQISGSDMDFFVNHLPTTTNGSLYVYYNKDQSLPEANEMTPEQVAVANGKGWTVKVYDVTIGRNGDWRATGGFWHFTEERFPDENFRNYLIDCYEYACPGVLTLEDDVDEIAPEDQGIEDLTGIEYFKTMSSLCCSFNKLTTIDLSNNPKISYISCYQNQIKGKGMDDFIASLRDIPRSEPEGSIYILDDSDAYPEGNEVTTTQATTAKLKGWIMYAWDKNAGKYGDWVVYEGATPTALDNVNQETPTHIQDANVYDVMGRRMGNDSSAYNKGIYIKDGRKVVIK